MQHNRNQRTPTKAEGIQTVRMAFTALLIDIRRTTGLRPLEIQRPSRRCQSWVWAFLKDRPGGKAVQIATHVLEGIQRAC